MALGATVHNFDIDLADADRNVYETLALRVARHPSESDEYLVVRVLAYCLEYTEGIAFSRGGLSDADEPPIAYLQQDRRADRDPSNTIVWRACVVPRNPEPL